MSALTLKIEADPVLVALLTTLSGQMGDVAAKLLQVSNALEMTSQLSVGGGYKGIPESVLAGVDLEQAELKVPETEKLIIQQDKAVETVIEAKAEEIKTTIAQEVAKVEEKVAKPATVDDVRAALRKFSQEQGREAAKELVTKHGVATIGDLKEEHYATVLGDIASFKAS